MNEYGDHSEDVLEKWEVAEASRAVVRAGFWKLMDKIAGKEENLVSIENYQLLGVHGAQRVALHQGCSSQEAVMDALVIKHLSRLCRQQVEQMSDNIAQYVQARGVRGGRGDMAAAGQETKKWVMLGQQAKFLVKWSLFLTCMCGTPQVPPGNQGGGPGGDHRHCSGRDR